MKYLQALSLALSLAPASILCSPSTPVARAADVNPYIGKVAYANKAYAQKLQETMQYFWQRDEHENAARTRTVTKIPTFSWISASADIANIKGLITDTIGWQYASLKPQILQLVVYNLPNRDCSAKASDGEFKLENDGLNKYKAFIDKVAAELSTADAKRISFVVILEPDSLANLVTNMGVEKCATAASAYKEGIAYALAKLQRDNVALYLDGANGGWLGWDDNLAPSAKLFGEVLNTAKTINPNTKARGLAINVSNYNQYISAVRENYTEWSNSWDEFHYVNSLTPHLQAAGFPAHFIIDQGRSGKGGIRTEWGQWCNVKNAGFGMRPTSDQAVIKNPNVDAIVWVKPGGESDGTSDRSSPRFDEMCVSEVAHVPAPEAGTWFNEHVVNLVKNADPPLEISWY
ncbi:cellobiohydrolase [Agrocybe pediades]|nr:cellobiohydrolase [Agrocybe pediades]